MKNNNNKIFVGITVVLVFIALLVFGISELSALGQSHHKYPAKSEHKVSSSSFTSSMSSTSESSSETSSSSSASHVSSSSVETATATQSSASETPSVATSSSEVIDPRPEQGETPVTYAYQAPDPVQNTQTVYVNASIPGRYHLDPNCRGLQRHGGGTPMSLTEAQRQGYQVECAYERYGN